MKAKPLSFTQPKMTLHPPPLVYAKSNTTSKSDISDCARHEAEGGSHDDDDDYDGDREITSAGDGSVGNDERVAASGGSLDRSIQRLSAGRREKGRVAMTLKTKQSGKV